MGAKPTNRIRIIIAKAAALEATEMKSETGVGPPEYASGAHMWNGTAATLNASETMRRIRLRMTIGLSVAAVSFSTAPMAARFVAPVVAYTSDMA